MGRSHKKVETVGSVRGKKRRDMTSAERVQQLQRKLYLKAKEAKEYRFYILYDKIFLNYVLEVSWSRLNKRAVAGIDGVTFEQIEKRGVRGFLAELQEDLRKQTYKPQPVKRVEIDKKGGGKRPLGIPTIRDRVAQMACKLIIEPLFEADFEDSSHGFRPKRSASGAIGQIRGYLRQGKTEVYDADLSKYFDTIPHDKLIKTLELRISDRRVIRLIKLWLKTPYEENGRLHGGKKCKVGTPQGGVISPLLSNVYLHLLDRIVEAPKSIFARHGVRIIRYADDFVLMGNDINEQVMAKLAELLSRMGLVINEKKSKKLNAREESFDFLGFTIRYDKCLFKKGNRYWNIHPSNKSCKGLRGKLDRRLKLIGHYAPELVASELNMIMRGWLSYYDIEKISYTRLTRKKLVWYLQNRLYRYYNRKSQRRSRLHGSQAYDKLRRVGMIDPNKWIPMTRTDSG